ncbi:MAG TPA: protein translocase subunit SecF [Acidimicrobiales bacterium]|nr:protein translocase subunit SecF [Acidimicrobiales bacterium]
MKFLRKLYSFEDDIDFRKGWKVAFVLSALIFVGGMFGLATKGLNLGIDFRGGTSWQFPSNGTSTETVRDGLATIGAGDAKIQMLSQGSDERVRVEIGTETDPDDAVAAMASSTGISSTVISADQNEVGPSWGQDVSRKALRAMIVFLLAVTAFISWRLEWRMAVGAIAAVVHDVVLSVAVYAALGFEVSPGTVIAFLTILGYSLYDTIVVYEKVKANEGHLTLQGDRTYTDMMNLSLNQTFMRSLNTTFSTVLPVGAILFIGAGVFGAITLRQFGLALFVGLIFGAYSSVFIASPIVAWLKEREPRNIQIRENVLARRAAAADPVADRPSETESTQAGGSDPGADTDAESLEAIGSRSTKPARASGPTSPYSDKHPPRPRKQGKKR